MNHLIKVPSTNKKVTETAYVSRNTTWFETDEKKDDEGEVMFREIDWSDFSMSGSIDFRVYKKAVYNSLIEYLKPGRKPPAFTGWLPLEFELVTKKYETEWIWPEGKIISCHHRWYTYGDEEGRIEFKINNKNLFEKFIVYVVKFKP